MADPNHAHAAAPVAGWQRIAGLGLLLRPETANDRLFLADLYASTRMEELAQTGWPEQAKREFLAQQFTAQHAHYMRHYSGAEWLVVERGGSAIGRLYFVHWARECRIIDIAFLPRARHKGFGTAALRDLIDQAGDRTVSIHVERMNPALALYRRLGFEIAEDKGVYLLLERRRGFK
ncbi:GNAT family N-acetyltransferase [Mesorhizobium sp. ZC-5]|uniref:GNAT family N-acetyltransferase n=1 Tax=Mesorhizobium sp. ZC-5 TaxID=2986066 RepID=UPI0021E8C795|nr:GNAT family N-acetyltransferase [Mesorhizobium sp. ZC-5]MCV3238429.1 GNAT family N-acetyltransferase [Mesorhizobium sp. ZC-5]